MRRSLLCLFTLAESRSMFLDAMGMPLPCPTATLPETLQVLAEHHHADTALVHAALARLLSLDSTDADSEAIASFKPQGTKPVTVTHATSGSGATNDVVGLPSSPSSHLMLQLMFLHANDTVVRERCCRCIANMCQLSSPSLTRRVVEPSGVISDMDQVKRDHSVADGLVEEGAVELVLGTLSMASRLSAKGIVWSSLALLNLVCLSSEGVQRAARAKGESVVADAIASMAHEAIAAGSLSGENCVAMDAMLGALARLLTTEADSNMTGVQYRFEQAAYGTVEAAGWALFCLSESAIRDIRGFEGTEGMTGGGSGVRRGATLFFPAATALQQSAVLAFLPPLHKAWMILRCLSGCSRNMPMVYEALHMPGHGGGLRTMIDAVLLFGVELEGLSAVGATEEATLQQNMLLHAMEAFVDLSATRKDLGHRALAEAASLSDAVEGSHSRGGNEMPGDGGEMEGISAVIPTEAALHVSDTLAAGVVSNIAVSTLVRLHTAQKEEAAAIEYNQGGGKKAKIHVYNGAVFDLLAKCTLTLANLAGHDIAVASLNTMAVLQVMLQEVTDFLSAIRAEHRASPGELFTSASQQELMALVQQCALTGQMYAALWGILRTSDGARAVRELQLHRTVREIQTVLEAMYTDAFPDFENSAGEASKRVGTQEGCTATQRSAAVTATKKTTPTSAAAVETMRQLIPLGQKVLQCLRLAFVEAGSHSEGIHETTGCNKVCRGHR
ncbi:hypothetical protein TcYC6_0086120 [Trypanosoma cruzi]|nr:hypothetical protein TcYC6_0086120 [Trypanosoma cruzi]